MPEDKERFIVRDYTAEDKRSEAVYSKCERYRYQLTREWDPEGRKMLFVLLNPSPITERQKDPVVERCERKARRQGYGTLRICNLFAWRDWDPEEMKAVESPVGADNDSFLRESCEWADGIVAAWGDDGEHMGRGAEVRSMLEKSGKDIMILRLTRHGHPIHPLYVPDDHPMRKWPAG